MKSLKQTAFKNLIGGELRDASTGDTSVNTNPADVRDIIGLFPKSNREDARAAKDAAREAQKKWGKIPPLARAKILFKAAELVEQRKEEFARTLTREEGKTLAESRAEAARVWTLSCLLLAKGADCTARPYLQKIQRCMSTPTDSPWAWSQ